jgi:nucleoid-associated protein YgaU
MKMYLSSSRYRLGDSRQTAERRPPSPTRYTTYTVREGDTIESIAARQLGDPLRYWEIADINPQFKFPLDIEPGKVIRLPL